MDPRTKELLQNYGLPLALTLVTIALSEFVGLVDTSNFLKALLLVGLILLTSAVAQAAASGLMRTRDRSQLYAVLTAVSLSRDPRSHQNAVLSEGEVLAIESAASEVWVYAYDLAWESGDSDFSKVARQNLNQGVPYRYLVPNTAEVRLRVEALLREHVGVARIDQLLKFKGTTHERLITQFGVTLYNPSLLRGRPQSPRRSHPGETVVVFFPHFSDFSTIGQTEEVFLAVRGSSTSKLQEAFIQYWDQAQPLSIEARDL